MEKKFDNESSKPNLLNISETKIAVWIRQEPFEFGVLSNEAHSNICIKLIRRISKYVREKSMFPKMTLNEWMRISKSKIQLPSDLAWNYFRLFDSLTTIRDSDIEGKRNAVEIEKLRQALQSSEGSESSRSLGFGDSVIIDSPMFILFLCLQHWNRPNKKFSCVKSANESWPEPTPKGKGQTKTSTWEKRYLEFIRSRLSDIVDVMSEGEPIHGRVSMSAFKSFDFLFAFTDRARSFVYESLGDILDKHIWEAKKMDYCKTDGSVDKEKLKEWILNNLESNPWIARQLSQKNGSQIADVSVGIIDPYPFPTYKTPRIFQDSSKSSDSSHSLWGKFIHVNNEVVHCNSLKKGSSLRIYGCVGSYFYIPGVFRYVSVQKCQNIRLFLGPASKVISFVDCENVQFHGITHSLLVKDSCNSEFYIVSMTQPILSGEKNKNLTLAPYNTFYAQLNTHLAEVNIDSSVPNLYNQPLELDWDGNVQRDCLKQCYKLMDPKDFYELVFPFDSEGETTANPFSLPKVYQHHLKKREESCEAFKKQTFAAAAALRAEKLQQFQQIIHIRFLSWLKETGNDKLLSGFESMVESEETLNEVESVRRSILSSVQEEASMGIRDTTIKNLINFTIRDCKSAVEAEASAQGCGPSGDALEKTD